MDYRSVTRDANQKVSVATREEIISASLLKDSKNGIYISDNARIKPKELDRIESQIYKAQQLAGIDLDAKPKYIIISDTELNGSSGGRFDSDTNTIFIKQMEDKRLQEHVIVHEHFHCRDLQKYIEAGGEYTDKESFISEMSELSKAKLDKKGVNEYNVIKISDYAERSYRLGRYDETYTEYRTVNSLRE